MPSFVFIPVGYITKSIISWNNLNNLSLLTYPDNHVEQFLLPLAFYKNCFCWIWSILSGTKTVSAHTCLLTDRRLPQARTASLSGYKPPPPSTVLNTDQDSKFLKWLAEEQQEFLPLKNFIPNFQLWWNTEVP